MTPPNPPRLRFLDVLVLALSVYVLAALLVEVLALAPPEVLTLMQWIDWMVCGVFLLDFGLRFQRAGSKSAFMRWGWIDLLSAMPVGNYLALGRAVRIIQIIRIMRALRSARAVVEVLYRNRFKHLMLTTVLIGMVLMLFCTLAILIVENDPNSNIKTPLDAVWWGVTTITTVGYGDRYPVTPEGRIIAMVLMIGGISLFGVLTGLIARFFLQSEFNQEEADLRNLTAEIRLLRGKVEALEAGLRAQRAGCESIETRPGNVEMQ